MTGKEEWLSLCKTIGCHYLAAGNRTQSTKIPAVEEESASEPPKESMTAQPRECFENIDWFDHCCRTYWGNSSGSVRLSESCPR
eukprot:9470119-Pyramimonas_sp.AAC.1